MADDRPLNWNWVEAIGKCKATVVFGELKSQAAIAVNERNRQLEREGDRTRYEVVEVDGIEFRVSRVASRNGHVYIKVDDQLRDIIVTDVSGDQMARYTVRLNDDGACRLFRDAEEYPHWKILKLALEPLLFSVSQ